MSKRTIVALCMILAVSVSAGPPTKTGDIQATGNITATGTIGLDGSAGPTWSSGSSAPMGSCTTGSMYSLTSNVSPGFYVCSSSSWVAVAGGTITGTLTSGKMPKATGAMTLGDSSVSDNGTTVSTSEALSAGAISDTSNRVFSIAGAGLQSSGATVSMLLTCGSGQVEVWNGSAWACGAGGITNGAGNNVIPKSNGTNLIASSLSDNGTAISTSEPMTCGGMTFNGPITTNDTSSVQGTQQWNDNTGIWLASTQTNTTVAVKPFDSVVTTTSDTTAGPLQTEGAAFDNRATKSAGSNTLTNYGLFSSAQGGDINYSGFFDQGTFVVNGQAQMTSILMTGNPTVQPTSDLSITDASTGKTANFNSIIATAGGSVNTTTSVLTNAGIQGAATATRSAGANALTNIGVLGTASGAQTNYSGYFDAGNFHVGGFTDIDGEILALGATTSISAAANIQTVGGDILSTTGKVSAATALIVGTLSEKVGTPSASAGTVATGSTNWWGQITSVGATSTIITYSAAFTNRSFCNVTFTTHAGAVEVAVVATSASTATVSCFTSSTGAATNCENFIYECAGQ
jgi:hypothetical protein